MDKVAGETAGTWNPDWLGRRCLRVSGAVPVEPDTFRRLAVAVKRLRELKGVAGASSAYAELAVYLDGPPADREAFVRAVLSAIEAAWNEPVESAEPCSHQIEARYDGPDLAALAAAGGFSVEEVVARHTAVTYTVAAVGFRPHFGYLWGLDDALAVPRHRQPRPRVPAGAVGIAGRQTAVYPDESPGGWQLIAQATPASAEAVCPALQVGDTVRFCAV